MISLISAIVGKYFNALDGVFLVEWTTGGAVAERLIYKFDGWVC